MRQISMREFRTRGEKALGSVPEGETVLLSGQNGPAYFLIPVRGDIAMEEVDLRLAMAKASLRQSARLAEKHPITHAEIEQEIEAVRTERLDRQARRKR